MRFLVRLLITAAALWAAVRIVPGIRFTDDAWRLVIVTLVFGAVNALIRPLLLFLTCPLVLLTLGLFVLVLNGVMLWLTSALAGALGLGFHVDGFGSAFWGALVVTIVSVALNLVVGEPGKAKRG